VVTGQLMNYICTKSECLGTQVWVEGKSISCRFANGQYGVYINWDIFVLEADIVDKKILFASHAQNINF